MSEVVHSNNTLVNRKHFDPISELASIPQATRLSRFCSFLMFHIGLQKCHLQKLSRRLLYLLNFFGKYNQIPNIIYSMLLNFFSMGSDNHELQLYKKYYLWNYLSRFHHHQNEHLLHNLVQEGKHEPTDQRVHQMGRSHHALHTKARVRNLIIPVVPSPFLLDSVRTNE